MDNRRECNRRDDGPGRQESLLQPDCGATPGTPRSLRSCGERQAVPGQAEGAGDDEGGDDDPHGCVDERRDDPDRQGEPSATQRSGTIRIRSRSDRRPTAIRAMPPRTCVTARDPAATPVDTPRWP